MADVYTRIGYIKGATGATGAQGAKGDTGDAATIQVGSVTTVPYGQTANVVNSGTEQAAVFDFTIPQGRPGQQTTEMDNLLLNSITTSAASFPIPAVGETGKVLWGKVTKWFSDMAALVATKLDAANVVNNQTTTASGYAMDARQANPNVSGSLGAKISDLEQRNPMYTVYRSSGNTTTITISLPQTLPHDVYISFFGRPGYDPQYSCFGVISMNSGKTWALLRNFGDGTLSASLSNGSLVITTAQTYAQLVFTSDIAIG